MIVAFNPYFLDGMAYKYDSPAMGMSILFPLIPFLFIDTARLYSVSSFFCALGMYMTYQSSSGIYIAMVIFVALLKFLKEDWSLSETAKFCVKSALLFIAASALFLLMARFLGVSFQYRSTGVSFSGAPGNIAAYFSTIARDFNGLWKALCLLVALAATFAACRLSKKKVWATLPIFIVALALALVLSQGSYIFLEGFFNAARGKYSFGALLAILASISVLNISSLSVSWRKILAAAPAIALSWSFFSYASAFGNAHANQMKMEQQYEALVRQDINELFGRDEFPEITIGYIGTGNMPWSGEVQGLMNAYPITKTLVTRRGTGFPAHAPTMKYFDSTLNILSNNADPIKPPLNLLVSRRYYNIYLEEGSRRVIVECKMRD